MGLPIVSHKAQASGVARVCAHQNYFLAKKSAAHGDDGFNLKKKRVEKAQKHFITVFRKSQGNSYHV